MPPVNFQHCIHSSSSLLCQHQVQVPLPIFIACLLLALALVLALLFLVGDLRREVLRLRHCLSLWADAEDDGSWQPGDVAPWVPRHAFPRGFLNREE